MKIRVRESLIFLFAFPLCEMSAQNCKVVREKPISSTQQGGYSFDYSSALGADCRIYKLRNHPGRLKTPVFWKSLNEVFVDTTLAECRGSQTACDWLEVVKTAWKPYEDKSLLSYGVNKDEYEEYPETYVEAQRQASTEGRARPIVTSIVGPIINAEGEAVQIGIRVASFATRGEKDDFKLKYDFTLLANGAAMEIGTTRSPTDGTGITMVWESAESDSFVENLLKVETRKLKRERTLTVEMVAPSIKVRWNSLFLMQNGRPIFRTTAPAYRAEKN